MYNKSSTTTRRKKESILFLLLQPSTNHFLVSPRQGSIHNDYTSGSKASCWGYEQVNHHVKGRKRGGLGTETKRKYVKGRGSSLSRRRNKIHISNGVSAQVKIMVSVEWCLGQIRFEF